VSIITRLALTVNYFLFCITMLSDPSSYEPMIPQTRQAINITVTLSFISLLINVIKIKIAKTTHSLYDVKRK
jgi:hypothetical protein